LFVGSVVVLSLASLIPMFKGVSTESLDTHVQRSLHREQITGNNVFSSRDVELIDDEVTVGEFRGVLGGLSQTHASSCILQVCAKIDRGGGAILNMHSAG
jgi:hypothetical protein